MYYNEFYGYNRTETTFKPLFEAFLDTIKDAEPILDKHLPFMYFGRMKVVVWTRNKFDYQTTKNLMTSRGFNYNDDYQFSSQDIHEVVGVSHFDDTFWSVPEAFRQQIRDKISQCFLNHEPYAMRMNTCKADIFLGEIDSEEECCYNWFKNVDGKYVSCSYTEVEDYYRERGKKVPEKIRAREENEFSLFD